MAFDFSQWAKSLPQEAQEQLVQHGFKELSALLLCTENDIVEIISKQGHKKVVWDQIKRLQKVSVQEKNTLDSEAWAQNLPLHVKEKLTDEALTSLDALLLCTHETIKELGLKKGDELITWNAIRKLQKQHRPDGRDLGGKARSVKESSAAAAFSGQTYSSSINYNGLLRTRAVLKADDPDEIRIVLIGKTGSGKSATGNTILGVSSTDNNDELGFKDLSGQGSGTTACQMRSVIINGQIIRVIDTPGVCDTHRDEREVLFEISKCLVYASPGPHVVLFVVSSTARFTKEEMDAFDKLRKLFHSSLTKYICVVFTHGDSLEHGIVSLEENLERSHNLAEDAKAQGRQKPDINTILEMIGMRYLLFSNKGDRDTKDEQVLSLLEMIEKIKRTNSISPYFTDDKTKKVAEKREKRLIEIMSGKNVDRTQAWKVLLEEMDTAMIKTVRGGALGAGTGALLLGVATVFTGGAALPLEAAGALIVGGAVGGAASKCSLM